MEKEETLTCPECGSTDIDCEEFSSSLDSEWICLTCRHLDTLNNFIKDLRKLI